MRPAQVVLTALLSGGCAGMRGVQLDEEYGEARPRHRLTVDAASQRVDYWRDVKPVLDSRCVVCHGCYDAPCQLRLTAFEGIDRGSSKSPVYDGGRLLSANLTRLFEDAHSAQEWRQMGFYPVLNERDQTPQANRNAGVMARTLTRKRKHPLPGSKRLPARFDLSLDRNQQCPAIEAFDAFEQKYPLWGMPYALPALSDDDDRVLMRWIEDGARYYPPPPLGDAYQRRIPRWETFLNGRSNKQQLMSRYIYEHLFLGHIYFDDVEERKYFRLVRSRTAPGIPINQIATRRPYDDPRVERVYYRLQPVRTTILAKTHMPYAFGEVRMARFQELFLSPSYEVTELPSYAPEVASNPFIAFHSIPASSRYRFMLDEARFTIMGFIKGPVCRGQIALGVIEDQFWVVFVDPDNKVMNEGGHFLDRESDNLRLPSSEGSEALLLTPWLRYSRLEDKYLAAKGAYMKKALSGPADVTLDIVWNGDRKNTNAALTIFRHFNSATVVKGFVGDVPKTAWLIEYPVLERIHYLLVAGFDVYGNAGHQLNSRLYMDFLRMEGEANFLLLLPESARIRERDFWYRGAEKDVQEYMTLPGFEDHSVPAIDYETNDEKLELFGMLEQRLEQVLSSRHTLAAIPDSGIRDELDRLNLVVGIPANLMPQTAFVRIESATADQYLTIVHNNAHLNITSMFGERKERLPDEDRLNSIPGFIGSYPNVFFVVDESELAAFVTTISELRTEDDYSRLLDAYGIRRTNPDFWSNSDTFHLAYQRQSLLEFGILDYSRLENR